MPRFEQVGRICTWIGVVGVQCSVHVATSDRNELGCGVFTS